MPSERIAWIDHAKGLGMMLVMLAHTPISPLLAGAIYTFHMPLFFFLSGYVFQPAKYPRYSAFALRRVQTLVVPYACFSLLNYLGWLALNAHTISRHTIALPLLNLLHPVRGNPYSVEGPLWFLLALFFAEALFYLIQQYAGSFVAAVLWLSVCFGVGYGYVVAFHHPFPWSVDVALIAVVFYAMGYYARQRQLFRQSTGTSVFVLAAIGVNLVFGYLNRGTDMWGNVYHNPLFFLLAASAGICYFVLLTQRIVSSRWLATIGQHSIVLLALHQTIVLPLLQRSPLQRIHELHGGHVVYGYVLTVLMLAILVPVSLFIQRYLPFMLGQPYRRVSPGTPASPAVAR